MCCVLWFSVTAPSGGYSLCSQSGRRRPWDCCRLQRFSCWLPPHFSVSIPSLTQNVLTAHVIGAYLSSVSPREQWLHLISEKYDVDYTGAYVELCDVAQKLWVRHSFNFLFYVANERVVICLMAPCREGYNKVNKVLSVLWAFCSHLH